MDAEILRELVQIKWWVASAVVCLLVMVIIRISSEAARSGGPREILRRSFARRARSLLEAGRDAELLQLAETRIRDCPATPTRIGSTLRPPTVLATRSLR